VAQILSEVSEGGQQIEMGSKHSPTIFFALGEVYERIQVQHPQDYFALNDFREPVI
jgi:hypothetical protein